MSRIAHFIDSPDPGGAESIVVDLCVQEKERGLQVEVWHFGNDWLVRKCTEYKIHSVCVPANWLYKSKYTIPLFIIFLSIFLKYRKIDLVHSHLYDPIIVVSPACHLARIAHVATLHDVYSIERSKLKQIILKYASNLNSRIIAVSRQIIDHIEQCKYINHDIVKLVHNGVHLEKYSPGKLHEPKYPQPGTRIKDVMIICVGRLVQIKGHRNLIRAFGILVAKSDGVKLKIVGDGPEYNNLVSIVRDNGLESRVEFLGHRDDVAELLRNSDIFALASHSEGLSCSIIEAMACGLPIIATNVGGNSEIVRDSLNGYLISDGNIEEFGERLHELVTNPVKRIDFGKYSLSIARSEFSIESMTDKYIALYDASIRARY